MRVMLVGAGLLILAACVEDAAAPMADAPMADAQVAEEVLPILTCGLPDCSQLGADNVAPELAAFQARLMAMGEDEVTELVALSFGQVGCPAQIPVNDDAYEPYYDAVLGKLGRNLGVSPAFVAEYIVALDEILFDGVDTLMAARRLQAVDYAEEMPYPVACNG